MPTGVSGSWSGNVVTISGTPTTSVGSPFNYTVTLTGGCGTVSTVGTITVTPDNTIALSSAIGTDGQTLCANTTLTDIDYIVGGSATGATVSGLPIGVSGTWVANAITISGTPSAVVNKLHSAFAAALNAPEIKDRMTSIGVEPVGGSKEDFKNYLVGERRKWAQVISTAKIKVD